MHTLTAHQLLMHLVGAGAIASRASARPRNPGLWLALWRLGHTPATRQALGAWYWARTQALLAKHPLPQ